MTGAPQDSDSPSRAATVPEVRYRRERLARHEAERLLEEKSRELFEKNRELEQLNKSLEGRVRVRTLELQQALARAEASSRSKSEFLTAMSHELRTPLNGVLATADLLALDLADGPEAELVELIRRSGSALLHIVDEVLDYSRLEAGGMVLASDPCVPARIAEQVVALFGAACTRKGIAITFDSPGPPLAVRTDPNRLRQIISNLVGNAVKFTSDGSVDVRVRHTHLDDGSLQVHVSVSDTGIGVEPEFRKHLFKRFSQSSSGLDRRFGGTGLGLAISQQIALLMNGEIDVDSTPGKGSTFTLSYSASPAEMPVEQGELATGDIFRETLRGLQILVAEDNENNRLLLARLLDRLGARHEIVPSGFEAVRRGNETRFDAILMDLQMPGMSGLEATRRIRAAGGANAATPIIAVSANAGADTRKVCFDAGTVDHVPKPIGVGALVAALSRALPGRLACDDAIPADGPADDFAALADAFDSIGRT